MEPNVLSDCAIVNKGIISNVNDRIKYLINLYFSYCLQVVSSSKGMFDLEFLIKSMYWK
jgi:hypothetical protein